VSAAVARLCVLAAWIAGVPALAIDGVVEINQTRALAGGITASDTPGFPVTLGAPGSYRLTGDLDVSAQPNAAYLTAIHVTASFVTVDLNGFSLVGPEICTGSPVSSCAPYGSGIGVNSYTANFVRIQNGIVRGFPFHGVLAGNATVEDVQAFSNGHLGISVEAGGLIRGCTAIANGSFGFVGEHTIVEGSRALENHEAGFYLVGGEVRHCEAVHNALQGIRIANGAASGNLSHGNLGAALDAPGSAVEHNSLNGPLALVGGVALGANVCNGALCP